MGDNHGGNENAENGKEDGEDDYVPFVSAAERKRRIEARRQKRAMAYVGQAIRSFAWAEVSDLRPSRRLHL